MGAGDWEILDVVHAEDDDDGPRLKVGDLATGLGIGQDCAFLCSVGFVGFPNGPDDSGGTEQILCWTPGNDRLVVAAIDNRFNAKAAPTLALGDRAIVSDCDAALYLQKSANKISLQALAQSMAVTLDAAAQTITSAVGNAQAKVSAESVSLSINGLGSGGTSVALSPTTITLQLGPLILIMNGNTVSIATQFGPPAELLVNLVPVAVP